MSTTDPDARVMKMPDGGFRPVFNVQLATTTDAARAIVGVSVTNRGSDQGQATPMLEQIEARTGVRPTELLVDGGYSGHDAVDQASAAGVTLYAPVPRPRNKASETPDPPIDPQLPKPGDSDAVAAWRVRMGTDGAKQIYKQRAATAETVNADAKAHRGMATTALRGLAKVTGNACLFALTYNILRFITVSASRTVTAHPRRSAAGWRARRRSRGCTDVIPAIAGDPAPPGALAADPQAPIDVTRTAAGGPVRRREPCTRSEQRLDVRVE